MKPFHLTDHELRTAKFCIDHGADMVVGHHHHAIRGMEWYQGKPIMYGLGHFAFELRLPPEFVEALAPAIRANPTTYAVGPREGWPLLPLHADTRMTMVAWAAVDGGKVVDIGFLPCWIEPNAHVVPFAASSPRGEEVVEYFRKCCVTQRLNARVVTGGPTLAGLATVRVIPDR
jgi:poly-gamma-glutamate synthesis protein (capsule biosynthesis protein)